MNQRIIRQNAGIDVAKDDFKACLSVMNETGKITVCGSRTFASTYKGFRKFYE
jgi:hypothetical protein